MRLTSLTSSNTFLYIPNWLLQGQVHRQPTLLYFLTGNPGLIAYYHSFLSLLSQTKAISPSSHDCIIAGSSLGGFDTPCSSSLSHEEQSLSEELCHPPGTVRKSIYSLQEQIELSLQRIDFLAEKLKQDFPNAFASSSLNVILIGHSLGTYMALELVRLHYKRSQPRGNVIPGSSEVPPFKIISTILLTPTIMDIAMSSSGKLATPVLSNVPGFPSLVQFGASGLTASLYTSWLRALVMRITGMRNSTAVDATVAFLQTPGCVKQSLALAKDELREITEDKWGQEVWGVTPTMPSQRTTNEDDGKTSIDSRQVKYPRHYFWFAKEDHWVADATREQIVNTRADHTIRVDKGEAGLVHAWCLEQSQMVAEQVRIWVEEVLKTTQQQ